MSSQSQGTASQHSLISKAYHSLTPIFCPRGGGLGKRGLHCFASCLAAAPLRGGRCRPGSERVQAAGRDKGLGGGARLPRCFPQSLARSLGRSGGPGPGPVKPPIPEAAASTPQLGATWAPPSPHSPPKPRATLPCLRAPPSWQKGPELPSPPLPVGPRSWAPSFAAQPGTGAGSPGRRFQGTVGEEEPAGPAARPPSRPEPAPPPQRARAAPEQPPQPPGAHPPPEPARQAAEAETRHPAAPARSGQERSAARRSAAPPPVAARAEPKGSSLLAAPGINARPSWQRLGAPPERAMWAPGAAPGALCPRPRGPAWSSCVRGAPEAAGHAQGRHGARPDRTGSFQGRRWTPWAVSRRVLPRAGLSGGSI